MGIVASRVNKTPDLPLSAIHTSQSSKAVVSDAAWSARVSLAALADPASYYICGGGGVGRVHSQGSKLGLALL